MHMQMVFNSLLTVNHYVLLRGDNFTLISGDGVNKKLYSLVIMGFVVAEELFSINMNIVIVMFHFRSADLFFHVRSADSHMRTWRKRVSEVLQ